MIAELSTKLQSVEEDLETANKCEILFSNNYINAHLNFIAVLVMRDRLISSLLSEEHRMETELNEMKIELKERETELKERESELKERESELNERGSELKERESELNERGSELKERKTELKKRETELRIMSSYDLHGMSLYAGSFFPRVQVNRYSREIAIAGQKTSIELIISLHFGVGISSLHSSLDDQLSCQLTDPNSQHVECSITSTEPGMATVSCTPTVRGAHQLKITLGDTDIQDGRFTVHVLPSLEKRGVPINTITGVRYPWGVAVSESREVVVSEHIDHCISVFSREGEKIRKFGGSKGSSKGQFNCPYGVAINTDGCILIADRYNHRIQIFTMDEVFVRSVGERGHGPLQFNNPAGIAVHPSGLVVVADELNHRIQVLHPDLSFSHTFGSQGSLPGQFDGPDAVACDSSDIVYVSDCYNHRVQLFSTDGHFISSFGSKGSQPGQLVHPRGICIDSTDTVYVTDENHRVSAFNTSGQFLKCFGKKGSKVGELNFPGEIAVDNTTGNIYVCDSNNCRVIVY